jgi:antitoxin HicB
MESIDIEQTLALPYTIKLIEEDGVFYTEVEEIPGCFSEGNTVEQAYDNIKDAMRLWMETAVERNIQIPVPKKEEEREFSGRIMLRMPKELHKSLTKSADNDDISLNQFIVFLLSTNFAIHSVKQTNNNWNLPLKQPYKSRKKVLVTR